VIDCEAFLAPRLSSRQSYCPQIASGAIALVLVCGLSIGALSSAPAQEVQPPESALRELNQRAASSVAADVERLISEAQSLSQAGNHSGAVDKYTQALALRPPVQMEGVLLASRASALARLGRFDEALRDNELAISLNANPFVLWARAGTLRMAGRYREALADYDAVLKVVPKHVGSHYGRGNALWRIGDVPGAKAAFDRAVALEPRNVRALSNRGYFRDELKDYAGAIEDYSRIIEIDPKNVSAYVNRGNALVETKDFDKALSDYNTAQQLNAGHVSTYRGRGRLFQLRGKAELARADYEQGLKLAPSDTWLRNALDGLPKQQP
jgi:tetratricopeptide (TPR) repeat protein